MAKQTKSIIFLTLVSFMVALFLSRGISCGETLVPPPPDKNKTLPSNDGGPDGCDSSRFKCVMEGDAVLDKQTGVIWAKNAFLANKKVSWQEAVIFCQNFELGNQKDWRLPTKEELIALLDTSRSNPALAEGHPFTNLREDGKGASYWTSTEYGGDSNYAWIVSTSVGQIMDSHKLMDNSVWPVRDSK